MTTTKNTMSEEEKSKSIKDLELRIETGERELVGLRKALGVLLRDEKYDKELDEFYEKMIQTTKKKGVCILKQLVNLDIFEENLSKAKQDINYYILVNLEHELTIKYRVNKYNLDKHLGMNDGYFNDTELKFNINWVTDLDKFSIISLEEFETAIKEIGDAEKKRWDKIGEVVKVLSANNENNDSKQLEIQWPKN